MNQGYYNYLHICPARREVKRNIVVTSWRRFLMFARPKRLA